MTQTPSRDWQKDIELCEAFVADQGWSRRDLIAEQPQMTMHWLQEAKTLQEIASGRGREYLKVHEALKAAEAREQRLKEVIEEHLPDILPVQRALIKRAISTLYPDTLSQE